jgi:hypothetical protein
VTKQKAIHFVPRREHSMLLCYVRQQLFFLRLYDLHRDRFFVNKINRCSKFQFYWYYYSTCFGSLSAHHQDFLAAHRHWYNLCSLVTACYQAQDIPIKLELSASVGFIHKGENIAVYCKNNLEQMNILLA